MHRLYEAYWKTLVPCQRSILAIQFRKWGVLDYLNVFKKDFQRTHCTVPVTFLNL